MAAHTVDHCHCTFPRFGSDHCAWCGCEEFETVCDFMWEGKCSVCGVPMEADPCPEPCYDCMNPEMPAEKWYYDGPGDEPGWQDSTFPNEY